MALFKISKGLSTKLPVTYNEGYCYFTTDDGYFYIDIGTGTADTNLDGTKRKRLNAERAICDADGNVIKDTYISKIHALSKDIGTAQGDMLYWTAASTPAKLSIGSTGQVLKVANGVPTWTTIHGDNIYYVAGNGSDTAGTWTGTNAGITSYYDGLTIVFVPAIGGAATTTLKINNLEAKTCYITADQKLQGQFEAGSPIVFTYYNNGWRRSDNNTVDRHLQVYRQTTPPNAELPVLVSQQSASSIGVAGITSSGTVYGVMADSDSLRITANPSLGTITAPGGFKGNADTATKLAAAKTITIGSKSNNFDGSGNITFTLSDIGAQPAGSYQAAGNYKTTQSAVSDPTASGNATAFIDSISQNANGVITVTKKNLNTSGTWAGTAANASKVANALSFTVGGVSKGSYDGSEAHTIDVNAADLNISGALTYLGRTATIPTGSSVQLVSGGSPVTAHSGNVVIYTGDNTEYLYDNTGTWIQLGSATSYSLAPHIHGNVDNAGYITDTNGNALANKVIISDSNGKITALAAGSNGQVLKMASNVPTWSSDDNTDTKVTQTAVTASDYTNWRPLIFGASSSGTEGFSPTTATDGVFATSSITVQPSTGTIRATTFKGNASTATKLEKAQTIQTNLGLTSAAAFDGSNNIEPGVKGTLPLGNGGTNATDDIGARTNLKAAGALSDTGISYYRLSCPDGTASTWLRTPSVGLLPYQSGGVGSGHSSLGTDSWYFSAVYSDSLYTKTINFSGSSVQIKYVSGGIDFVFA